MRNCLKSVTVSIYVENYPHHSVFVSLESYYNASHKLLRRLGANGSYLGFYYTASAIDLVMDSGEPIYQCKWLYGEVAKLYHTTPYCVERNIRTVVDAIWSQGNRELLVEIIPYPANAKPKNAQFIDGLVSYLSDMEE